jgi:hypothetical protein
MIISLGIGIEVCHETESRDSLFAGGCLSLDDYRVVNGQTAEESDERTYAGGRASWIVCSSKDDEAEEETLLEPLVSCGIACGIKRT